MYILLLILFLIIVMGLTINTMKTEHYRNPGKCGCRAPRIYSSSCNPPRETNWMPTSAPFCNDDVPIDAPYADYISPNQELARGCNPKTLVPIPSDAMNQAYDFCQWSDSPYISNSAINNAGKTYLGQSGYIPESCSDESFGDWTGPQFVSSNELVYYTKNQPINSNIGISETPGFPRTKIVDIDDIYDPRQTGYGSNDRYYVDEMTGQPRFYYDDIESIQRPQIQRSNVDFLWNVSRDIVEDSFIDRTNAFRQNLEESLMSKRNSEMWQLKQYPLRRDMGNCWHA
jgi:hypothetical protein